MSAPDYVILSVPGRDDADPTFWYVVDRATRRQIGGEHASYLDARHALAALVPPPVAVRTQLRDATLAVGRDTTNGGRS